MRIWPASDKHFKTFAATPAIHQFALSCASARDNGGLATGRGGTGRRVAKSLIAQQNDYTQATQSAASRDQAIEPESRVQQPAKRAAQKHPERKRDREVG